MDALDPGFFERAPPEVARELLGHLVVHDIPSEPEPRVGRIVETEAYLGPEDPGSHATRGRHTQAGRLWDQPGLAYVYICYGVHHMLNVVAHEPGGVGAVLLRAAEPIHGIEAMQRARPGAEASKVAAGPGNLARAFSIRREDHEGVDLRSDTLRLARGERVPASRTAVTGRIGLSQGSKALLRFVDTTSESISRSAARPPTSDS